MQVLTLHWGVLWKVRTPSVFLNARVVRHPAANAFCFRIRYNCVHQQYLIHVEEKGLPPSHTFPQSCAFSNNLVGAINPIHVRIAVISNLCLSHFDFPPPVGNFSFLLTMTKLLLCDLNGCQHGHRSVVFSL